MSDVRIITNNQKRPIIYYWELTNDERNEFSYANEDDTFFRYKWELYCLADFMSLQDNDGPFQGWQGYSSDSYFSGIVIKYPPDNDYDFIIVGWYCS